MKAHLANPNLHTDADRRGISFGNKNKKLVGKRKLRKKKVKKRRKRRRLVEKKMFVDLVLANCKENVENPQAIEESVDQVVVDLRRRGIILRKDALERYVNQRELLQQKFPGTRSRIDGAGASPDSFLILKKTAIEKDLEIVRRIPNVTMAMFFQYVSDKYPEQRAADPCRESEERKRFYRFKNFVTVNRDGLHWNTGRPQGRDATTELLKARAVYYTDKDQVAFARKHKLKNQKHSIHFDQMSMDQNGGTARQYGNMWGRIGSRERGSQQESSKGKGGIGLTGFLHGSGEEFQVILKAVKDSEISFKRMSNNTGIMIAPTMWLDDVRVAAMCEYVVPRTNQDGECVMFDDAGVHNKIVESFFLASGRTSIRVYGGATGVKQVGDDSNFNGRKKNFCRMYVAKKRLDALMKVPREDQATYKFPNIVTPESVCDMIQKCIDQPKNMEYNLKSLSLRLPTLSGPNVQSNAVLSNIKLYEEFLASEDGEDPDISLLPADLQKEVRTGMRTLGGAKRAWKNNLHCEKCGQWRSSKATLESHPCPWKLTLPYCPRSQEKPDFPFVTAAIPEHDEYEGHIVQIFTDLQNPQGSWENALILDAYEDGTMRLQWLLPRTFSKRRGRKSKFVGKWQTANGGQKAIPWRWLGRREEKDNIPAPLDDEKEPLE